MGLFDCVANPEGRDRMRIDESNRPIARPKELSRSDHDISRRRGLPLFASQTSLKNVRDIDFWRQKVLRYLYTPEGREDIRILRVPFQQLGYATVTDFISAIPVELFQHFEVPQHKGIFKDDKVFWERDGIAEAGIFKWHGFIDDVSCIGLQLDRKKAVPFGIHDGKGLFTCKPGHRALVPASEIIPYKQFLRQYLGLPPKKDSLLGMFGSVRVPAKAIKARNSKAGDRVYLHKEKKYATVQWIGKIDNEIVVDLVYERSKPEEGKPVSPDEPYISRSVSLADFIGELDSEPNSPISPGIGPQAVKQTVVTATVENHAAPSTSNKEELPLPPRSPKPDDHANSETENSSDDDVSDSEEDDDSETESESEEPSDVSENEEIVESKPQVNEEMVDAKGSDEEEVVNSEEKSKPLLKSLFPAMENVSSNDALDTVETEQTPTLLPSPKRKGFFRFSPKPSKRAKSKPQIEKLDLEKDLGELEEIEQPPPLPPQPTPRSKSPNIFGNFKFGLSTNKKKKTKPPAVEESKMEVSDEVQDEKPKQDSKKSKTKPQPIQISKSEEKLPTKFIQKKTTGKSSWGGLFKSRSKTSLKLLTDEPSSPIECSTPLDEMIPPDKIPTPPPTKTEGFNERQIERPDFLNLASSTANDQQHSERSSVQSPLSVPITLISDETRDDKKGQDETNNDPVATNRKDYSESEDETSSEDEETNPEMPPPVPKNPPPPDNELGEQVIITVQETTEQQQQEIPQESESEEESEDEQEEPTTVQATEEVVAASVEEDTTTITSTQPTPKEYLERFKQSKVRNRPSSFGSFLARIKNQKRKPDGSLEAPTSPTAPMAPTTEQEMAEVETGDDMAIPQKSGNGNETEAAAVSAPANEITASVGESNTVNGNEGDQEGIMLDLLEVNEPPTPTSIPSPSDTAETPKRKAGRGRTFSFTFAKKRKPSNSAPAPPKEEPSSPNNVFPNTEINNENMDPNANINDQSSEENEKSKKPGKPSSFRNSFKRTFSLTRKKPSIHRHDSSDDAPLLSQSESDITKPRPVTLYIDNNEAMPPKQKNSFRNKRPASVHVDVLPWNARHGMDGVDIYSSPSSEEVPQSPVRSPNPALTPKQSNAEIPKHRIFTTPAFFYKRGKKPATPTAAPENSNAPQRQRHWSSNGEEEKQRSPTGVPQDDDLPQSPSTPQSPPPPLPTAPPPLARIKRQPSVGTEKPTIIPESPTTKLKSALKQRKEIDSIPKGLKVNDRVLWYSGNAPIPGTVQRLFKDGTDKYTAMVKFDREVTNEPLRLIREGDAYMITVEELITPDMFGPEYANPSACINVTPATPTTPSVRFDGVATDEIQTQDDDTDSDEELDLPPPFQEEEVSTACGFQRGIQCQDKSCCLETVLFSLFYTTNVFDISMLYGNTRDEDPVTCSTRRILRKEIVDPLRRKGFCDFRAVKKLRDAVKPLSDEWQTLSTDAEVMMFILFDRALKLGKFISYSNDMSDFLHQLDVDTKDLSKSSTIQHLFETSLHLMDKIKLQTVPTPALILEMPRSNDKLIQYKAVIPNLSLHVSHLMNNGPRLCICGMVAKYECTQCSTNAGKMSIVYCDNCKGTADVIHFQLTHETQLSPLNQTVVILDLTAIICVKGGHYFSFVKCGNHKLSPWVYFDGAEIDNPKVCIEQNLGMWLDRLEKYPGRYQDALQYPLLTHILQDSHICIYQPREKSSSV